MSFYDHLAECREIFRAASARTLTPPQIQAIIHQRRLAPADLAALLSPAAVLALEEMAQAALKATLRHFGRSILLYTPLYLSNFCDNNCVYCAFNAGNRIPRAKLTPEEVRREAQAIAATGLQHILILTGESRRHSPISYLQDCVFVLKEYFSSIAIELYPLTVEEYAELAAAGADSLTIYQEVYDEAVYLDLHPSGPKRDYRFRLEAPERAGRAGFRAINIGALLGLADWREEAFMAAVHAAYLQDVYPDIEISLSLPRMRPFQGGFPPPRPVSDRDLVQILTAFRLFLPQAGITMSTRESADLRDRLIGLGVTKTSAGSVTAVGGRMANKGGAGQFEIADRRSVAQVYQAISARGYKPIFKDWHPLV